MPSILPCAWCGTRTLGHLERAYMGLLYGADRFSASPRLCSEHMTTLIADPELGWTDVADIDGEYQDQVCGRCHQPVPTINDREPLFLTAYRHKQERQDFYSVICLGCVPAVKEKLGLKPVPPAPMQ